MYRDPTSEELKDPLFKAIWQTIKKWDINVPDQYGGYMGATGNHVCAILDVVRAEIDKLKAQCAAVLKEAAKLSCGCRCHQGIAVTCVCGNGWECNFDKVSALITADFAAALARREAQVRIDAMRTLANALKKVCPEVIP
jgi:hypothetical protein